MTASPKMSILSLTLPPTLTADLGRFSISLRRALSRRRPWIELIETSTISRPSSISAATSRIRKNLSYFRINYLAVLAAVIALSLLYHPLSLLTMLSVISAWLFYLLRPEDRPLAVFNRSVSEREAMWILIGVTVVVVFLTNIVSMIIWAILIGMAIVCAHGALRDPEDLFVDEQEFSGFGIFSFFGGGGSSSSVSVPEFIPPV